MDYMRIRTATPDDIPAMLALAAHSATAAHWRREEYLHIFAADALLRLALVMEDDSKLVAFIVALCAGLEWEIESVAVAGSARRRGLGTRLIIELLDRARAAGAQSVVLEVRESNHAARALYEKSGFEEEGRRKSYYPDPPEDAIVYKLSFPRLAGSASNYVKS